MCELLGVSIDRAERPTYAFRGFQYGSRKRNARKENADGWGIACYPDDGPAALVLKEAAAAHKSKLANAIRKGRLPKSRIHVLHIRRRGKHAAPRRHANTHPFSRIVDGREYVFAHNGYLRDHEHALGSHPFSCLGGTASEHAFCHILGNHEPLFREQRWGKFEKVLR